MEAIQSEDVTRFKFVDEAGVNLPYARRYGRAVGGRRVRQGVPLHGGPNVTVVGALSVNGLEAVMTLDGALNRDSLAAYLDQVLGPTLRPGDVVVLDNLRVHQVAGTRERIEACGARVLFLPPYSPDSSPIENGWSKFKTWLRMAQARTRRSLGRSHWRGHELDSRRRCPKLVCPLRPSRTLIVKMLQHLVGITQDSTHLMVELYS